MALFFAISQGTVIEPNFSYILSNFQICLWWVRKYISRLFIRKAEIKLMSRRISLDFGLHSCRSWLWINWVINPLYFVLLGFNNWHYFKNSLEMFIVVCKHLEFAVKTRNSLKLCWNVHLVNCANMLSYSLCFELLLQIYVTKDGKEMTGRLAYRQYRRVL